jgi:hypothetical protein
MKQLQTLVLSGLLLLVAQLISDSALAEESRYTGTIESVSQEGEQITVSGRDYRISYKALFYWMVIESVSMLSSPANKSATHSKKWPASSI